MIRTILFFTGFGIVLFFSFILYLPYLILKLFNSKKLIQPFLLFVSHFWGRFTIISAGGKLVMKGEENIPRDIAVCFIGNHQSNMDIPLMLGYAPVRVGFLAKKELDKMLIVRSWMRVLGCVFVDRKNMRDSLLATERTLAKLKEGLSMVIFPEGTRSKGWEMRRFKEGSIRLLIENNITIVPFTISGSFKLYEEKMRIKRTKIILQFHLPIDTSQIKPEEVRGFSDNIWTVINKSIIKN